MDNAAIATTVRKFRCEYSQEEFTKSCHGFVANKCMLPVDDSNDRSWNDCYQFLAQNLPTDEPFQDYHMLFEFVMPESLCRADVVILARHKAIVLEFKQKKSIERNDIAQAAVGKKRKTKRKMAESRS